VKADLRQGLTDAWRGELFGEALMRALRKQLEDAAMHASELDMIARTEGLMADALARVLVDPGDPDMCRAEAIEHAARTVAPLTRWTEFLALASKSLEPALARFESLRRSADSSTREVIDLLVRHEAALIAFLNQSAVGCPAADNMALQAIEHDLRLFLANGSGASF